MTGWEMEVATIVVDGKNIPFYWDAATSRWISEEHRLELVRKRSKPGQPRRRCGRLRKLTRKDREKRQARRERNGRLTGVAKVKAKHMGGKEVPR